MSSLSPVISGVPQDTVIAPVLFLLMISVIAREVSPSVLSFVDDTSVKRGIKDVATDWVSDLQTIYDWAEDVGLGQQKFECVGYWPGNVSPDQPYLSPDGTPIEEKSHLRDQSRLDYCSQLWSPSDQASITKLVTVARHFTYHIEGMEGMNYWGG